MRRQLKPRQTAIELANLQETELTSEQMAAYLRQSSTKQVEQNLESADLQLSGALKYAVKQGLDSDKIVVAHEGDGKKGVSGTLRIDQREQLREIMADVKAGKIKLIWAYSVSRLFRDKYGVQVGTFIELCAKNGVKVVIETAKTFDFRDSFDVMMFQFLANVASKENDDRTRLLTDARRKKSLRGEYDGRTLVTGFIVDRNKKLADGKDNPKYGHFVIYEPHAKVVRRLYARYRELSGRFNLLANEVASMPVVFPDFEEWVNPLDINKVQLKKVHGGYQMSRVALYHLLTAIEYMGYWKVNGSILLNSDNEPMIVHDSIVSTDDWTYAFNRLSWTTLTGDNNPLRIDGKDGWVQADKSIADKTKGALLQGILTSTLGTVRYSSGFYNVAVKRAGKSQRSNTLSVRSDVIDMLFKARMAEKVIEMYDSGNTAFIQEQLALTKVKNATALVTVDEQIGVCISQIANIRAFIKAMGTSIDIPTMQDYNQQLIDLGATLAELKAKKNAAAVEESSLSELANEIKAIQGLYNSERFIKLACESISLDEYSSRFLTLTINWRSPFQQTDVCYIRRDNGGKTEWSPEDEQDLKALYPHADRLEILQRFPNKTWLCITSHARVLGIKRLSEVNTSGITDRVMSLLDHKLLTANGWSLDDKISGTDISTHHHWLYNTSASDIAAIPIEPCWYWMEYHP